MREFRVTWSSKVDKQLSRIPGYIRDKFIAWALAVERVGMPETRKLAGFHDEPLKGVRNGQRSVRLNRSYRAIYVESIEGLVQLVEVIEVNKHDY
jgi:proteic killer suppression protein